jgi:FixJ family two-component response regulator
MGHGIPSYDGTQLGSRAIYSFAERIERRTKLDKKRHPTKIPMISIVDDDVSLVEATVSLVESVGYIAEGFCSAEDFLKSPQLPYTDCLILDIRMPSMGGFELQRRLAARNHSIPIIFVTSYDSDDAKTQATGVGAVALLYKPFSQESLLQAVRSALKSKRKSSTKDNP